VYNPSAVYVFRKPPGGWVTTTQSTSRILDPLENKADNFGVGVAITGSTLVIFGGNGSNGVAYVFGP
jgi:hypothetical protein